MEAVALTRSDRDSLYPPTEKIKVIEVENFPLLGELTAFRFIKGVLES